LFCQSLADTSKNEKAMKINKKTSESNRIF